MQGPEKEAVRSVRQSRLGRIAAELRGHPALGV